MKIAIHIVRTLLGLAFVVFGLNGFLNFIPNNAPPPPPDSAVAHFLIAFSKSGYLQIVAACQVLAGVLLLLNFLPVFGLTILCGIVFNIIVFHLTMAPALAQMAPGILVAMLTLFLVWAYWDSYRPLFRKPQL